MIEQAILIGLATWRIASLLVNEDGPFNVFLQFRHLLGLDKIGEIKGFLPTLFGCVWCISIWTAVAMWGLWELEPIAVMMIAAMTIALTVERWMSNG